MLWFSLNRLITGAQDCHGGAFEMGLNALLEEIEEGDEGEAICPAEELRP